MICITPENIRKVQMPPCNLNQTKKTLNCTISMMCRTKKGKLRNRQTEFLLRFFFFFLFYPSSLLVHYWKATVTLFSRRNLWKYSRRIDFQYCHLKDERKEGRIKEIIPKKKKRSNKFEGRKERMRRQYRCPELSTWGISAWKAWS